MRGVEQPGYGYASGMILLGRGWTDILFIYSSVKRVYRHWKTGLSGRTGGTVAVMAGLIAADYVLIERLQYRLSNSLYPLPWVAQL